ncbi:HAD-IA family hydrolase [Microtetraspora sp. NBRC 16547]|uniref:HAD-IA family hydrolase n=1 Tax=Microtetraspora sp. NBRC 16547 TaxID=3030993 RepID=UPI00249FE59F|nr:HAD-IA family hydrolase [Microtetraspora sp. NBRC 16547]GLW98429.1 hydrolase [Microtetraspora sp. NBRC 16547]
MTVSFDAVLCDFDGVLRFHDPAAQARIDEAYGLAPGTVLKTALSPALMGPATLGQITCEEWEEWLVTAFAEVLGSPERAARLVEEFAAVPAWIDEGVRDLLAEARRRVPVVLVTNATTRLEEDLDRLGMAGFANAVVSSARVGIAKPDRRIYEIAAGLAGAVPERCLFVDDRPENVAAAVALGMTGVVYGELTDLRTALAPLAE